VTNRVGRVVTPLLWVLCAVVCAFPPEVAAQCLQVDGGRLTIKPIAANRHSRITWKTKDRSLDFIIADPTRGSTLIELLDAGSVLMSLPYSAASASAWSSSGTPVRKWQYRDRNDPAPIAGIRTLKSRPTRFDLKGKDGVVDSLVAPLTLPAIVRVTDNSGACFEAVFSSCSQNEVGKVKCRGDAPVCTGGVPASTGGDRLVSLDLGTAVPFPEPSPLRGIDFSQQTLVTGTLADQLALFDETFSDAADRGGQRRVRVEFRAQHWPHLGFDDPQSCQWQGVAAGLEQVPKLDLIVSALAAAGDEILMRMSGTPALLSSDCDAPGQPCLANNVVRPDGAICSCNNASNSDPAGYSMFPPANYGQDFADFWGCVVKHYALLGVRKFEIWNEPDVPDSFRANPADSRGEQPQFIEMFEQMRVAIEQKLTSDVDLAAIAPSIRIGGPAMSSFDAAINNNLPLLPTLLQQVDQDGGELDFVSFHMYTSDPGSQFAQGAIAQVRAWLPAAWTNTELSINEWQTSLGWHVCQLGPDLVSAPTAGLDASVNCDHRGAGYAVYVLSGFVASGSDVAPYLFEMFDRNDLVPDDFYETGMGLTTAHGLPKPEAVALWAASQLSGDLLGANIEVLGDRSFGWLAARDSTGVVHILLGQVDSDGEMHFTRSYNAAGFDLDQLIVACGCGSAGGTSEQNICLRSVLEQVLASSDRPSSVAQQCPALGVAEQSAVLDGMAAWEAREALRGRSMELSIGVAGIGCSTHQVEVFEMRSGSSSTESFRASNPAPTTLGDFNSLYSDQEWKDIGVSLWAEAKTPTQTYALGPGRPIERVTLPAYGAVYLRIF